MLFDCSVGGELTLTLDNISRKVSIYTIHIDWIHLQTRLYEFVTKHYGPNGRLIVHQLSQVKSRSIEAKGYWSTQLEMRPNVYKNAGIYHVVICESGFMQEEKTLDVLDTV